jgi:mono/diheme cytochrome c family protein
MTHSTSTLTAATVAILFAGLVGTAAAQDPKVERGRKLFESNRCTMCHSIEGKGNQKGPLDDVGSRLSEEEIRQWLVNPTEMMAKTKATRKPAMPNYSKLSKEDIDALVAFQMTLKKK